VAGDAVKTVWLDNPPVNALSAAVIETIRSAFENLDAGTRVIVLRGVGEKAFSAGADISGFKESAGSARVIQGIADLIEAAPVPAIAAIHGYCLGGGFELALACDFRIARREAQLGFPEVRLGLLPGGGGTQRAPQHVGPARAAWLIMSGERISAPQAEQWGLVEFVADDLDAEVERVAGILAAQSPNALREIKQLLRATRARRDFDLEYEAFQRCLASDDGREGVAAFLEKRSPRWQKQPGP
jgi:enoyl-CoA hydratase/carnithine racemase